MNTSTPFRNNAFPKSQSSHSRLQRASANQVSSSYRSPARRAPMHNNNAYCPIKCEYTIGCMPRSYSPRLYSSQRARSSPHRQATRSTPQSLPHETCSPIPCHSDRDPCPHTGEVTDGGWQKTCGLSRGNHLPSMWSPLFWRSGRTVLSFGQYFGSYITLHAICLTDR